MRRPWYKIFPFVTLVLSSVFMRLWGTQKSLDAKYYYSSLEAEQFMRELTQTESQAYFRNELFDLVFLFSYSFLAFFILKNLKNNFSRYKWWGFLPGFFDLIETSTVIFLLFSNSVTAPSWLGVITCLKWTTSLVPLTLVASYFLKRKE